MPSRSRRSRTYPRCRARRRGSRRPKPSTLRRRECCRPRLCGRTRRTARRPADRSSPNLGRRPPATRECPDQREDDVRYCRPPSARQARAVHDASEPSWAAPPRNDGGSPKSTRRSTPAARLAWRRGPREPRSSASPPFGGFALSSRMVSARNAESFTPRDECHRATSHEGSGQRLSRFTAIMRPRSLASLFQFAPPFHPLFHSFFVAEITGLVPHRSPKTLRQILLGEIGVFRIERVAVAFAVAQILHQSRRRIPNVQRHRLGRM